MKHVFFFSDLLFLKPIHWTGRLVIQHGNAIKNRWSIQIDTQISLPMFFVGGIQDFAVTDQVKLVEHSGTPVLSIGLSSPS